MKLSTALGALGVLGSALLLSGSGLREGKPEIGKPAPEIQGKKFLNSIGRDPSLESLRGQAVLIEFWFTT